MGNDNSRLKGLVIDKSSVDANDFWTLYNAEMPSSRDEGRQMLSIFQGEQVVSGQLWVTQGPVERAIKNLRIYRHPYILKYISTWEQGGQKYLATERVRPLLGEVKNLSDIQVCLGLRTILCSLIFLIEKAQARHLNICMSSINIAIDGSWRLAGFEYVWRATEVTKTLLDLASSYRYKKAVDPHEMQDNNIECIEQYAFATLCEEILSKVDKPDPTIPHAQDFCVYCSTHLKHKNAQMRPSLSAILLHPYFNHEFVLIHSFLIELPLKSLSQKQEFFTSLIDRLRCFDERIVGEQLSDLLLSRMVLLDPTAQLCVTPYVLRTKNDHSSALFSNATYTHYLLPHIKKKFRLRDAQIRLILLEYFMEFVRLLPKEELQHFVLSHLQAGLHDTNDVLVAKTMRCLADLVPILGSKIVVGGERVRIFSDGRPQAASPNSTTHWVEPRSITPVMGGDTNSLDCIVSGSPVPFEHNESGNSLNSLFLTQCDTKNSEQHEMPPRLSPDGGEDDKISTLVIDVLPESTEDRELTMNSPTYSDKNIMLINTTDKQAGEIMNSPAPQIVNSDNLFVIHNLGEEEEPWSDWETDELQRPTNCSEGDTNILALKTDSIVLEANTSGVSDALKRETNIISQTSLKTHTGETMNDDLNALDITVQKTTTRTANHGDSYDFFKDMEPVIETRHNDTNDFHVTMPFSSNRRANSKIEEALKESEEEVKIDTSRFAAIISDDNAICLADANGWGVEDDDVGWDTTV